MADQLRREHPGTAVEWWPFLLRSDMPLEGREIPREYLDDMEDTRSRLKLVADSGGLELNFPGRMFHTRRALEATEYAGDQGRAEEFHRAVFHKLYGEALDIGSWDVLRAATGEAGLDPEAMESQVSDGSYRRALDEKLEVAAALGIHAVPTYVINDRYRIVGVQPLDAFLEAIDLIEREG